jgi:flagellar biosynthesis component FlhA
LAIIVGVAVPVLVIGTITLVVVCWWKKKKAREEQDLAEMRKKRKDEPAENRRKKATEFGNTKAEKKMQEDINLQIKEMEEIYAADPSVPEKVP